MASSKKLLVVIAGPTAVGKSAVAISLAKHFSVPIISADSRQFFKEIPIGTAQPSSKELAEVKHYFIASHSLFESYTAGQYENDVNKLLAELFEKDNIAIMCGGSGLYIDAVLKGIDEFPEVPENIRTEVNQKFEKLGLKYLQEEVKNCDPIYFAEVDINNPRRLSRALEIFLASGNPFSSFRKNASVNREYQVLKIALNKPREELYNIINKRVDLMLAEGLKDEAMRFYDHKNINALQTVGYKEIYDFADGKISWEEAVNKIKQHSRNYAKRQITWFKKDAEYVWFGPKDENKIIELILQKQNQ